MASRPVSLERRAITAALSGLAAAGWLPGVQAQIRHGAAEEASEDGKAFAAVERRLPTQAPRRTFMASGYAGQMIWIHPPLDLVVVATSTISAESQRRAHAFEMLRGGVVAAAQARHP